MSPPRTKLVVIGASWGGIEALQGILGALRKDFPAAVAIVQHRAEGTDDALRQVLARSSVLPLPEVEDKLTIEAGRVYVAPAGYHLLVDGQALALSTDAPVSYARPSIDVLFESAAESFGAALLAVVLTGAGRDGARGLAEVKARGGFTVVQSPESAESAVLPRAALALVRPDRILPLVEIGPFLQRHCAAF